MNWLWRAGYMVMGVWLLARSKKVKMCLVVLALVVKRTSSIRDVVDETFNELPVHQQGGSVYLKLIYDVVFNMTEPVIRVLQNWIKGFAKHGLYKFPGDVRSLYDAAWNIAKRLHEVEALPSDAAMDILMGLTKATNDDFTRRFTQ